MQPIIPGVVNDQTIRAVRPDDTALRAGQLMTEFDISAVVVCDEREQIVGIVTAVSYTHLTLPTICSV